ncbi:MAG: rod shape-determining protein RodA [Verrucomicrobiota bacterium]
MYETDLNPRQSRIDWLMIAGLLGLMVYGLLFIYSAKSVEQTASILQQYRDLNLWQFARWLFGQDYFKQLIWYAGGIGMAVAVCFVDYRILARWSMVGYWATIILLVFVMFFGSTKGWGARRWIDLGFMSVQPSEFAKIAFIVALAHFLSRPNEELRTPKIFWQAIGLIALPFLLILKEPDLGSALMFLPVGLAMMFVGGVPKRYIGMLVGSGAVVAGLLIMDILFSDLLPKPLRIELEPYQKRRLLVYFNRDFAPPNATEAERRRAREEERKYSYNIDQALISVGSGGFTGKGWCQGTQNALGFLPRGVAHNDFIFSVVAEESGFVGSVIVIMLYTVVLFTGIRIASQARDRLGKLMAVGVVALFFSQVFVNIGMNIRIMPVTGVPLPLLSYGGSSVLCSLIAAGIMQNVYVYRKSY